MFNHVAIVSTLTLNDNFIVIVTNTFVIILHEISARWHTTAMDCTITNWLSKVSILNAQPYDQMIRCSKYKQSDPLKLGGRC